MSDLFDQDTLPRWSDDPWDDVAVAPDLLDEADFVPAPRQGRGWRWVVAGAGAIVAVMAIVVCSVGLWAYRQINPSAAPGPAITVSVDKTTTVGALGARLETLGIIDSASVYRWYAGGKAANPVAPGYYIVHPHDSLDKIIKVLQTPPELTFTKVTFPEGSTLDQIARRLEAKVPRLSAETFLSLARNAGATSTSTLAPAGTTNLEGLLFPDTYQIAANSDEQSVLTQMVDLMNRVAGKERIDTKPTPEARYDVVKIASLIEREAKLDEDRPKIARVIFNRLFLGMPLDIDAALLYGTPGAQTAITDEMKATDGPYNTYKRKGLPPTPIAMPSRASLHAAMNPATGDWLYYVVSDAQGHHVFAKTYAEHQANVAKARAAGLLG